MIKILKSVDIIIFYNKNKVCYLCNSQAIEGEFYFIMMCPICDEIRHVYLPHLDNVVKDITAFCRLMNFGEVMIKIWLNSFIMHLNRVWRNKLNMLMHAI